MKGSFNTRRPTRCRRGDEIAKMDEATLRAISSPRSRTPSRLKAACRVEMGARFVLGQGQTWTTAQQSRWA